MAKVLITTWFLTKFAIKSFVIELRPKMLSVNDGPTSSTKNLTHGLPFAFTMPNYYNWKEPSTSYMNKPFFSQHSILTLCLYVSIIPFLCRGCTCLVEFMYSFTYVDFIIYRIHLLMYYKRVISWNHLWSIYYIYYISRSVTKQIFFSP